MSAERNKRPGAIGAIPLDSVFSPVRRVTFSVEPVRVEQSTDFDQLVLEIETDGSISPREALASAGATLRSLVRSRRVDSTRSPPASSSATSARPRARAPSSTTASRSSASPSARATASSAAASTRSPSSSTARPRTSLSITNFGQTSLKDVTDRLDERGLALRSED